LGCILFVLIQELGCIGGCALDHFEHNPDVIELLVFDLGSGIISSGQIPLKAMPSIPHDEFAAFSPAPIS